MIDDLIKYAEDAKREGYPFEVTGGDLDIVLRALELLKQSPAQPGDERG